ncbi:calcineurin-like phosphoesterase family protein [Luteimonas kalidii]|uniref:Calcineurin-like phosphoesterase family protein n=1 Tax=Luteimonas kalidii TaxID=3042025 RepID=A0ABT6JU15_9GAMM|nr:calcineurin-like phosphoesterase family protein [Luteimonas kalidii]MDH5834188.1 calcineurin-like phosphoesterase family protein [Luteimonas kalidii]
MRHRIRFAALVALLASAPAGACVQGEVFVDASGDGVRQASEAGLADVLVSNGREIVSTDAGGHWRGLPSGTSPVFVVKPAGFTIALAGDGLPGFWRAPGADACDFALQPQAAARGPLKVLVTSDPQAGTPREAGFYATVVDRALRSHRDAALGLTLGDIANDDLSLYPQLNRATTSLGVPWLHLPGNHDLDPGARDDAASLATYRRVFGPDTFAWEEPHASFVMLDNVVAQPGGRPAYVGGLREDQFEFLAGLLPTLDPARLLVVAAHIPWFDTAAEGRPPSLRIRDRERLFALLQAFPNVLLLSGHRHAQRQVDHGSESGWHGTSPLREFNVGAMSGAYWSGIDDADGIPVSTMADGTPRGFATLHVAHDGSHRLAWHPTARLPDDPSRTDAMALHAPQLLRRGAYPAWGVYANVFLGHDGTRVEYRVDGGEWQAMERVERADPRLAAENARDDAARTLRGFDRSPEADVSPHLWRGPLPTRLDAGRHRIEVRSIDDAGRESRATTHYRLEDAAVR